MDNEKLFSFMEKMYGEMQQGFNKVDKRFDKVESDIKELKDGQLKIENKLDDTRKTLFDGYKQNAEGITELKSEVELLRADTIRVKTGISKLTLNTSEIEAEVAEMRLKVIEGGKKDK